MSAMSKSRKKDAPDLKLHKKTYTTDDSKTNKPDVEDNLKKPHTLKINTFMIRF